MSISLDVGIKIPTINIRAEFLLKDSENSDFRLDLDVSFVTMYSYLKTQDPDWDAYGTTTYVTRFELCLKGGVGR
ncbi:hypothetical protein GCM10026988_34560 [Vibrio panuliri]